MDGASREEHLIGSAADPDKACSKARDRAAALTSLTLTDRYGIKVEAMPGDRHHFYITLVPTETRGQR